MSEWFNHTNLAKINKVINDFDDKSNIACIAYGVNYSGASRLFHSNLKIKFFAFNGVSQIIRESDIIKSVKRIIGNDAVFVNHSFSSNKVDIIKNKSYKNPDNYKAFFDELFNLNSSNINYNLLTFPEKYNEDQFKDYQRYFSCAEKKISTYSHLDTVYVTKKPCYLCLPYLNNYCVYIDESDNIIHKIQKLTCLVTLNSTSYKLIYNFLFRKIY